MSLQDPRQFVLLLSDSHSVSALGCSSGLPVKTPHLDRLASQGLRFERAYTTCPLCTPARSALFTGTFSHTNGAWANEQPIGYNVATLGRRLGEAGVRAAYVGKWHLSATDYFGDGRCPPGWDPKSWYDGRRYIEDLPEQLRGFSRRFHEPHEIRAAGFGQEMTFAHRCSDRAVAFLRENQGSDFLLVVSYDEPHHPSLAPPPFCNDYRGFEPNPGPVSRDGLSGKPESHRRWAEASARERSLDLGRRHYAAQPYFACVSYLDHEIGRVLEAIERYAPHAAVVYTSDHGEMMGAHGLTGKGEAMYDEITRVPFLVRWPRVVEPAVVSDPLSHIDMTPTVLEFFGLPAPPFLQGSSQLGAWRQGCARRVDGVFMEYHRYNTYIPRPFCPVRAVYDGRHKLVINLLDTDELYDLESDPAEACNLIGSQPLEPVRARLHRQLLAWMQDTHDPFLCPQWAQRAWGSTDLPRPQQRSPRPRDGYEPEAISYNTGLPWTGPDR